MGKQFIKGAGGTEGGLGLFAFGFCLAAGALYLFVDSVRVTTGQNGIVTGALRAYWGPSNPWKTTSMGLIFLPFFLGVVILFFKSSLKIGWVLMASGLLLIVTEILSQLRFYMHIKLSHMLLLIVMMAAGTGLILRSFRDSAKE